LAGSRKEWTGHSPREQRRCIQRNDHYAISLGADTATDLPKHLGGEVVEMYQDKIETQKWHKTRKKMVDCHG
jgi:hypothetical protein